MFPDLKSQMDRNFHRQMKDNPQYLKLNLADPSHRKRILTNFPECLEHPDLQDSKISVAISSVKLIQHFSNTSLLLNYIPGTTLDLGAAQAGLSLPLLAAFCLPAPCDIDMQIYRETLCCTHALSKETLYCTATLL